MFQHIWENFGMADDYSSDIVLILIDLYVAILVLCKKIL